MSSLLGNIFRRKFWISAERRRHQCPIPSSSPPSDYHDGGYKLYKGLALLLGLPIVLALSAILYIQNKGHEKKREPFVKYEYLRLRSKPFPWGDGNHSLFHNARFNPLPDGYEDGLNNEDCEDEAPANEA